MRKVRLIVVVSLLVMGLRPERSSALCYMSRVAGPNGAKPYHIPVYLEQDGTGFVGYSFSVARRQLEIAISIWNETAGMDFRLYYAGATPPSVGPFVFVRDTDNCDQCDSNACERKVIHWDFSSSQEIWLESSNPMFGGNCPGNPEWLLYPDTTRTLVSIFVHELGHAFGLMDEYLDGNGQPFCDGQVWDSAMSQIGRCASGRIVTRRDIYKLENAVWNQRNRTYATRVSTDAGLTWSNEPVDSVVNDFGLASLGMNDVTFPWTYTEVIGRGHFDDARREALIGSPGGSFTTVVPWPTNLSYSFDVPAAALRNSTTYAVAMTAYEQETDCRKAVILSMRRPDGYWINSSARDPANPNVAYMSAGESVSLTYDPNTDQYIAAWIDFDEQPNASSNNFILLHGWNATTGARNFFYRFPIWQQSRFAPSLACNKMTNAVGGLNCMLAYQNTYPSPSTSYVRLRFSTSGVDSVSGQSDHSYATYYTPTLTAQDSIDYPFLIGLQQGDTFYTWRYSVSQGKFVDQRAPVYRPGNGMLRPTLGAQNGRLIVRYLPL